MVPSLHELLRSMMKMRSLKVPVLREKAGYQSKNDRAKIAPPPLLLITSLLHTDMRTVSTHIWVIERQPFNSENARMHKHFICYWQPTL